MANIEFLPPATKLGQGYVFTGVCDSVNGAGEGYPPGADPPPGADTSGSRHPPWEKTPPGEHAVTYGQRAGGTHPTGMQSCSLCMRFLETVSMTATTLYNDIGFMGIYNLEVNFLTSMF